MWVNVFCSVSILYLKDDTTWNSRWVKIRKQQLIFCSDKGPIFWFQQSFIFLLDSQHCSRAEGEDEKDSTHQSLTPTALLKGSDVTDTSLLFVFATPISSVTGACRETRQSITIPSLLPVLSPSSLRLYHAPIPRLSLSITLNLSSFLPLFAIFLIPTLASHCLLITHPASPSPCLSSLRFTAACLESQRPRE